MSVKEIIKEIMAENSLSQNKLADVLDVSQQTISNWLAMETLPLKSNIILNFYEHFGITPNELLGLEEPKNFKLIS